MRISDWSSDVCSSDLLFPSGNVRKRLLDHRGVATNRRRDRPMQRQAAFVMSAVAAGAHEVSIVYLCTASRRLLPVCERYRGSLSGISLAVEMTHRLTGRVAWRSFTVAEMRVFW